MVAVKATGKDKRHRIRAGAVRHAAHAAGMDMSVSDKIRERLTEAFQPVSLDVVDESHLHKGHAGHRPEGESHFRVRISAEAFRGLTRVAIHRMVYDALKAEIDGGVHALAINASVPAAND
jgi:BolA protein